MQVNFDGEVAITPSAHRHGIAAEQIRHAVRNRMWIFERGERFVMVVGPDESGRMLEVGLVVPSDDGEPIVVHAMPARAAFVRGRG